MTIFADLKIRTIMKKVFVLCIGILISTFAAAQEENNPSDSIAPPPAFQRQVFVYSMAKKYNDLDMAKSALYNILSINPNNVAILDSLALIYYEFQEYASAAFVSQDILALNPNDMLAAEIAAISFESLGVKDRALPYYEKLYLNNNNLTLLYQIAFIQYELKRYNEANTNIDIIENDERANDLTLVFAKTQTENQQVPFMAGIHRLKAMIANSQGDTEEAKNQFNKALEIAPDFEIVKIQLQQLN